MPKGVTMRHVPKIPFLAGATIAEIPFLIAGVATGQYHLGGAGVVFPLGGISGMALSGRSFATKAPLPLWQERALQRTPSLLAQEVARILGPPQHIELEMRAPQR
jgi:hypothetical protein